MSIIRAEGLRKTFGSAVAVENVDLQVPEGAVIGILGPNGAGKSTTVHMLTTLLRADRGTATVAGFDVARQPEKVRRSIGLCGQYAALDGYLTGRENLRLVGRLHHMTWAESRRQAAKLLEDFGLAEAAERLVKTYSGGMRRRLDLAAALVASPPVLFLDEPTVGLDPHHRQYLWLRILELASAGTTVLLTTQHLEEADHLADEVAVIDGGRVVACGTPDQLKDRAGEQQVEVTLQDRQDTAMVRALLLGIGAGDVRVRDHARKLTVPVTRGPEAVAELLRLLADRGTAISNIALLRPTLDDVFFSLTGHAPPGPERQTQEPVK